MRFRFLTLLVIFVGQGATAHSASDAYLTLTEDRSAAPRVLHGQWDIALRDLDFVLGLNESGSGQLSWGEVRRQLPHIVAYAYEHLRLDDGGAHACVIKPLKEMIDQHADGAYAVLLFDVTCTRKPQAIRLDYDLFFDIDPSHRAIFVMRSGADIATAVLGPQNSKLDLH